MHRLRCSGIFINMDVTGLFLKTRQGKHFILKAKIVQGENVRKRELLWHCVAVQPMKSFHHSSIWRRFFVELRTLFSKSSNIYLFSLRKFCIWVLPTPYCSAIWYAALPLLNNLIASTFCSNVSSVLLGDAVAIFLLFSLSLKYGHFEWADTNSRYMQIRNPGRENYGLWSR